MEHIFNATYNLVKEVGIYSYVMAVALAIIWYILIQWKSEVLTSKVELKFLYIPVCIVVALTFIFVFYAFFAGLGDYYVTDREAIPIIGGRRIGDRAYGSLMAANFLAVGACLFEVLMIIGAIYLIARNTKEEKPNMQKKSIK